MNSKFTPLYGLLLVLSVLFINASGGPGDLLADAPGDSGTCTNCHFWGGPPTVASGNITLIGAPTAYTSGTTYTFKVRLTDGETTFGGGGFQLVATDGMSNAMVGTFTVGPDTKIPNGTSGRLTHAAPKVPDNTGVVEWDVTWQAPASAPSMVEFYYAGNAANLNGGTNGDRIYTGSTAALLPVQWASFEAINFSDNVQLHWQTATERNNDYFAVERSTDGRSFEEIARVNGRGNSETAVDYAYNDSAPPEGRTLYYRLRQVDFDGAESFSEVRSVERTTNSAGGWTVSPNPARRGETLAVRGTQPQEFVLFGSTGRPVQRFESGRNEITLRADLTPGIYWLYDPASGGGERLLIQ